MTIDASETALVTGYNGLAGTVQRQQLKAVGPAPASVEILLTDGRRLLVPTHLLQPKPDGNYCLPLGPEDIHEAAAKAPVGSGRTIPDTPAADSIKAPAAPQGISLAAEHLEVYKRRVETGKVRVTKSVETHEEVVDVPVEREDITIERLPLAQFVAAPPPVRYEGDVMIISLVEEVLVVEKRLRVREELRLTTRRSRSTESHSVTLRTETAHVDRVSPD